MVVAADAGTITQLLIDGIVIGGIYGLLALGLSLVFGVMGILNSAHGALYMLSAYIVFTALNLLQGNILMSLAVTLTVMMALGMLLERVAIEPLSKDPSGVVILTLGLAILLEQSALLTWGGEFKGIPAQFPGVVSILGLTLQWQRLAAFAIALSTVIGLKVFLAKTTLGKATRMVAYDREASMIFGVNVTKVSMITFGVSSVLVAIAAILLAPIFSIYPSMGWDPLLISFAVVIVGGMGNINGTLLASVVYGLVETFVGYYIASEWKGIAALLMIILTLIFRPQGILGRISERI